jgi:hypothetical protein
MDRTVAAKTIAALTVCAVHVSCGAGGASAGGLTGDGATPMEFDGEMPDSAPPVEDQADRGAPDGFSADGQIVADARSAEADSGPNCPITHTPSASARSARSAGYSGSDSDYYALYGPSCQLAGDCVSACVAAGGNMTSCAMGSQCLSGVGADGGAGCVPPPVWLTVAGALSESGTTANAAQVVMVSVPYEDPLVLTDFGLSIPEGATITGIQVAVRRATLSGNATDETIQVVRGGSPVGTNHAKSDAWPTTLTAASYGGAYDTWGDSWNAADVTSAGFGVSVAPKYTGPASGNEHAYVDSVRVTVFYAAPCD